jgi:hypothetical protein
MTVDAVSAGSEPNSGDLAELLANEAARIEENALYTGNANFERASMFERVRLLLGIPATVAGAAAGASFVLDQSKAAAALFAFAAATLTALVTFLNPEKEAAQCHVQGASYISLEHAVRRFRLLDAPVLGFEVARARLEHFAAEAKTLDDANHTGNWAFRRAQAKIASGDLTFRGDRDSLGPRNQSARLDLAENDAADVDG